MKLKKSVLLCLLAVIFLCSTITGKAEGSKYTIPDLYLTVEIPEDMYVFEKDFDLNDENLEKAGISNALTLKTEFENKDVYLNAISKDGTANILILNSKSDLGADIYNTSLLSETDFDLFLENFKQMGQGDPNVAITAEKYEHKQVPFFRVHFDIKTEEGQQSELIYGTIVNGYMLNLNIHHDGSITEVEENRMKEIVDSITFDPILDKPAEPEQPSGFVAVLIVAIPILIIGLIIVLFFITTRLHNKKIKQKRALQTERLTEYRRLQDAYEKPFLDAGKPVSEPPALFSNTTEYTKEAVTKFCNYHQFHRNIGSTAFSILVGLCCIGLTFLMSLDENLVYICVLLVFGAICIIIPFFRLSQLQKANEKMMHSFKNKNAVYHFRELDFRINGMHSGSVYPYAQVTHAYESKDYFYLYFGDEYAHYVDKEHFEQGTAEEFRSFLKTKLGSDYKRR